MSDQIEAVQAALGDRYRLLREIGAGGVAVVYLADDLKHARPVAVKVLRAQLVGSIASDRFLREIQITAGLTHPNIVPLFDSGEKDGIVYFVMPFQEGESLRDRLSRQGQLPIFDAVRLASEIADALEYAHQRGIVHRDVKPANVLLSRDHALVADFGVARAVLASAETGELTASGLAVGTSLYMSPEQATGEEPADARSDIYALGCVLYEMLAGQPPFHAPTLPALLAQHLSLPPPSLRVVRPSVSEALEGVVCAALEKLPADRFASAADFRDALRPATVGPSAWPTAGRRDRTSGTGVADKRPRPGRAARTRLAAALGAGVLVAITAGALLLTRSSPAPASAELSPDKIVVFPLANRGGGGEEAGADVSLVIGMALEQTDPLKWIDGWTLLAPEQRATARDLPAGSARTIAREQGAAHYLDGAVHRVGDSVSVSLFLYDTAGDSLIQRVSSTGHAQVTSADRLGLRAVVQILPTLVDPGRRLDLAHLVDRDPRALALWMQGEREYRFARFGPALDLFERAVDADSLLAVAALKGAQAAGWAHQANRGATLAALAVAHEAVLPPRHRALARGLHAFTEGRADDAVREVREALSHDPEWPEALTLLGEIYRHLIPSDVQVGRSARDAFARAYSLEANFVPPLIHLAEIALHEGDLDRSADLLNRLDATGADPGAVGPFGLALQCARYGPGGVDWAGALESDTLMVLGASVLLATGGRDLACAETGFRAILEFEAPSGSAWGALQGLQGVLILAGRGSEARELLSDAVEGGTPAARLLHVLGALAGAPMGNEADALVDLARERAYALQPRTLWLVGAWTARRGNLADLRRVEDALRASLSADAARFGVALAAHRALAEADSLRALVLFAALPLSAPRVWLDWDPGEGLPVERMLLACLHLARGEHEEARRAAETLEHPQPVSYVAFLAEALRVQMEAAHALGETAVARALRVRLENLGREDLAGRRPCSPYMEERP